MSKEPTDNQHNVHSLFDQMRTPPIQGLDNPLSAGSPATENGQFVYPNNFADFPKSVGDIKSDKSGNACDWTPRECLIDMLRQIDAGNIKCNAIVIGYAHVAENGLDVLAHYQLATPNILVTQGILAITQAKILKNII